MTNNEKQIALGKSVTITIAQPRTTTLTSVTVLKWVDNPNLKTVNAITKEAGVVKLWTGADYDAIGNWTEEQAESKLISILTA